LNKKNTPRNHAPEASVGFSKGCCINALLLSLNRLHTLRKLLFSLFFTSALNFKIF
jgi:hypothetical protein